ncbi:MAG TPA: DNA topoisomerase IB [Candidatus Eisenbacteria bacterium]|nr:DNA topoisomerase IB [Candidatus Eisenbacteria bacterium]
MTIVQRLQAKGIRRTGSPKKGFRYRLPGGGHPSAVDLERIDALKIPPAWTDVAIHTSRSAMVQAVGKDRAGRWQYHYHEAQTARREERKRERLLRFIEALPKARKAMRRDLALPGLPREKVLAGILRVLATCFLRPGSEVYAAQNGTFGIATLRRGHVTVTGDRIRFDFPGKSGKRQTQEIADRRLARLIRDLLRYPGEVFKFRSESGDLVDVRRQHINEYIKTTMGGRFSAKDFRTWAGSLLCACALARGGAAPAASPTERKRRIAAAIREVAHQLGNTPAVCRSSYVFPAVLQRFEEGRVLPHTLESVAALTEGGRIRVERCERALLRLLRESGSKGGAERKRRTVGARRADEPDRSLDPPESGRVAVSG